MKNNTTPDYRKMYDKASAAICTITGVLEAKLDDALNKQNYKEAFDLLRDLKQLHRGKPLTISTVWLKEYNQKHLQIINHLSTVNQ